MRLGNVVARPGGGRLDAKRLAAFRNLELLARRVVEGFVSGRHRSPFKGFAIEFQEHRPYVPGDDLKHLDWKVLAKLNRYCIKQYEEDTSLRAFLVVDCSGSMSYRSARHSKFDCARFIAGVMSCMLIRQEDAVGLVTCTSRLRDYLPPRSTRPHLKHVMDVLASATTGEDTGLGGVLHALANRIKRRGLIVIISDFFDNAADIILALNHFAHKKHELILFQVLDRDETLFPFRDMTRFESLEGAEFLLTDPLRLKREYLRQFNDHEKELRQACHRLRVDFVRIFTDDPIERTLARYLAGRLRT